jgi:hypothetical protein
MIGIILLGFGSILFGFMYYFKEVYEYLSTGNTQDIQMWQVSLTLFNSTSITAYYLTSSLVIILRIFHTAFYGIALFSQHPKSMVLLYTFRIIFWLHGKPKEPSNNNYLWYV